MAERRMFAKQIIDSDLFLEMPLSAQVLYFHLAMRADDDGFVDKPKSIMRLCGNKDEDMKILIERNFIIPFDSGIVVITHWKIHNYIRSDRYRTTQYKSEKQALSVIDGTYIEDEKCHTTGIPHDIPLVDKMDTQVIDRDRIGYSKVNTHTSKNSEKNEVNYKEILSLFSEVCVSLPKPYQMNDTRKSRIIKANKELNGDFKGYFERIEKSDFLTGRCNDFRATFDWILKPNNMTKILEGNYDNRTAYSNPNPAPNDIDGDTIF